MKLRVRDEAFEYYFYFMQERMKLFLGRYREDIFTEDETLKKYRFTNVYRACDRVSQYLINDVIEPLESSNAKDLILNIMLFKVFNKIATWEELNNRFGYFNSDTFEPSDLSQFLTLLQERQPIFNAAYIMTASSDKYRHLTKKHSRWLEMIKVELIHERRLERILDASSLQEVYEILKECTFIGPFLAYQYAIDLNYSNAINFSENSFVVAGIGAIRGIKKCFSSIGDQSPEYAIKYTQEHLSYFRDKYGYSFTNLYGREPTLIDLQNCFCETDKLLRVKLPELSHKQSRIKQRYKKCNQPLPLNFPQKWNLNIRGELFV